MKLFIAFLFITNSVFAAMPSPVQPKAAVVSFTTMTAKQFGIYRGKSLNLFERISYNAARRHAFRTAVKEGEPKDPNRFNILGFILGLIFPYGLIASYFFKDRSVRRSAWIGFGVILIVAFIILLSYAAK